MGEEEEKKRKVAAPEEEEEKKRKVAVPEEEEEKKREFLAHQQPEEEEEKKKKVAAPEEKQEKKEKGLKAKVKNWMQKYWPMDDGKTEGGVDVSNFEQGVKDTQEDNKKVAAPEE